jgi:autotransporter-associated beta strand protein
MIRGRVARRRLTNSVNASTGRDGPRPALAFSIAIAAATAGLSGSPARANTQNDVVAAAQDLANTAAPPYSSGALPTATDDVTFRSDVAYANASSLILTAGATGVNILMGTLNDLNATPLVISGPNAASGANRTITLNGGGNTVAGSAGTDLVYLASGASLTLRNNVSGTRTLGVVLNASGDFDVSAGATLTIPNSVISGAFDLRKTGGGTLTLGATNTFGSAGGLNSFTMAAGTLNLNSARAVGNANNTLRITGGTIDNTSGAAVALSSYPVALNGDFAFAGTNDLSLGTGAVSLGASADASRTVAVNAGTLTIGGVVSNAAGAAATSLNKAGAGTLVLGRANLFSGGLNVLAGTVRVGNNSAVGTGPVTLGSPGHSTTLDLNGATESVAGLSTAGAAADQTVGNSSTTANAILTLNGATTSAFGGRIVDSLGAGTFKTEVVVNETGAVVALTGNNTYSGGTTITSGTLQINSPASMGAASAAATIVNGTLEASANIASSRNLLLAGASKISVASGVTFDVTGTVSDGVTAGSLNKKGAGTLTLAASTSYTGGTNVDAGTLAIGSDVTASSGVTVAAGAKLQMINTPEAAPAGTVIDVPVTIAGATGAWTATVDLTDNDMIVRHAAGQGVTTLARVNDQVKSGLNFGKNGFWDGPGITSSTAAADPAFNKALGAISNDFAVLTNGQFTGPFYSSFADRSVDENAVLVKYTWFGDADLSGSVDGTDYGLIDAGFLSNGSLTGWFNGDFDYSGTIDGTDYGLIDGAFLTQDGSTLGSPEANALLAKREAQFGEAYVAALQAAVATVPEPGAALALVAGASVMLCRRRRTWCAVPDSVPNDWR